MHSMCFELAEKINAEKCRTGQCPVPAIIVAISRGGLVVARILSDFLKLPIYNIAMESYKTMGENKEPVITQDLGSADIKGKNILLVDEICDTGKTFERAVAYLNSAGRHGDRPLQIKSACLITKTRSSFIPDYFCAKIDKWVIFPYEVRETVEELKGKMTVDEMVEIGLPKNFIERLG